MVSNRLPVPSKGERQRGRGKQTRVRARAFTDLLGLRSRHGNDAPDPLSNGLLGDDDELPDVNRVLQMAAGEHGATAHFTGSLAHRG